MSEAPKVIWAFHDGPMVGYFVGKKIVGAYVSEYILASEHDRLMAEKDAFEEAAKVAETNGFYRQDSEYIAAAIRAMKHEDSK